MFQLHRSICEWSCPNISWALDCDMPYHVCSSLSFFDRKLLKRIRHFTQMCITLEFLSSSDKQGSCGESSKHTSSELLEIQKSRDDKGETNFIYRGLLDWSINSCWFVCNKFLNGITQIGFWLWFSLIGFLRGGEGGHEPDLVIVCNAFGVYICPFTQHVCFISLDLILTELSYLFSWFHCLF